LTLRSIVQGDRVLGGGLILAVVLACFAAGSSALAQPAAPATSTSQPAAEQPPQTFGEILLAGGWVGLLIILLSVAAVALSIEHIWTIRTAVLMPPGLGERVRELLKAGQPAEALRQCQQQPSFLAFVLQAGLAEMDGGWPAVEKAMEDAAAEQSARLFRKIEFLSVIGNIAPMLGLLGTVIGMIVAFREVATTQGAARAADLAEGIYLALVTTVEGLVVAIPSLTAFAVFRNRVDQLVAEVAYTAQHAFAPARRNVTASHKTSPAPPPVEGVC
jgi:biopolymer transport protein ExbB